MEADQSLNKEKIREAQTALKKALGKRIKKVQSDEKDDLKWIKGLGPFVETKLNRFGIFTFEQISQLDEELINTVTDALQFFPGRIVEDDWVGQASDLLKIKLTNPS
jgi:predicted flap endonuclease-1-like 5' DNA nuclease